METEQIFLAKDSSGSRLVLGIALPQHRSHRTASTSWLTPLNDCCFCPVARPELTVVLSDQTHWRFQSVRGSGFASLPIPFCSNLKFDPSFRMSLRKRYGAYFAFKQAGTHRAAASRELQKGETVRRGGRHSLVKAFEG